MSSAGEVAYADYFEFWTGDEADKYPLHIGQYVGAAEGELFTVCTCASTH